MTLAMVGFLVGVVTGYLGAGLMNGSDDHVCDGSKHGHK